MPVTNNIVLRVRLETWQIRRSEPVFFFTRLSNCDYATQKYRPNGQHPLTTPSLHVDYRPLMGSHHCTVQAHKTESNTRLLRQCYPRLRQSTAQGAFRNSICNQARNWTKGCHQGYWRQGKYDLCAGSFALYHLDYLDISSIFGNIIFEYVPVWIK